MRVARFEIQRAASELATLRNSVRLLPMLTDLDHGVVDDVVLIISELVSNAIAAARPASTISVGVERAASRIEIVVENVGPPMEQPAMATLPRSDAVRGRGLAIVSMLSESVRTEYHDGRTRVTVARSTSPV